MQVGAEKWRVGVVALMGEEAWSVVEKKLRGGLEFMDPFAAAEQAAKELREQGAELVVCLSHTGIDESRGPTNDGALAALGIFDAVFSGHAHFRPRKMEMQAVGDCLLHPGVHNGQAVVWARFSMQRGAQGDLRYSPLYTVPTGMYTQPSHPFDALDGRHSLHLKARWS